MKRACIVCGKPADGSRCPLHKRKKPWYGDAEYQRARRMLKGAPCAICGAPSSEVHHVIPRSLEGGLMPLCHDCHLTMPVHDPDELRH